MANWTLIQADDNAYGQCCHVYKNGELWLANSDIADAGSFVDEIEAAEEYIGKLEALLSTALVPVMVGEARELRALHTPYFTIGDGDVYQGPHNVTSLCARNKPCNFDKTLIVQPVRLVPALEAMEEKP